jgi:hypothetical protein
MLERRVKLDFGLYIRGSAILFVSPFPLEVDVGSQLDARFDKARAGVQRGHEMVDENGSGANRHFNNRGLVRVQASGHELRRGVFVVVAKKRPTKNKFTLLPRTALPLEEVAQPRLALHPLLLERHVMESGTQTERPQGTDKVHPRAAVNTVSPRSLGGGVGVFDLEPLDASIGKVSNDVGLLSMLIQNDTGRTQSRNSGGLGTDDVLSFVSYAGNMTHALFCLGV